MPAVQCRQCLAPSPALSARRKSNHAPTKLPSPSMPLAPVPSARSTSLRWGKCWEERRVVPPPAAGRRARPPPTPTPLATQRVHATAGVDSLSVDAARLRLARSGLTLLSDWHSWWRCLRPKHSTCIQSHRLYTPAAAMHCHLESALRGGRACGHWSRMAAIFCHAGTEFCRSTCMHTAHTGKEGAFAHTKKEMGIFNSGTLVDTEQKACRLPQRLPGGDPENRIPDSPKQETMSKKLLK